MNILRFALVAVALATSSGWHAFAQEPADVPGEIVAGPAATLSVPENCEMATDIPSATYCTQRELAHSVAEVAAASRAIEARGANPDWLLGATLIFAALSALASAVSAFASWRTMVGLDRPHLYFWIETVGLRFLDGRPRDGRPENMVLDPATQFFFRNEGRAPALIKRLHAVRIPMELHAGFPAPMEPLLNDYTEVPHGASVPAQGRSQNWHTVDCGLNATPEGQNAVVEWFLQGYVVYSDPMASSYFVTGFLSRFDANFGRWVLVSPPARGRKYNYSRRIGAMERWLSSGLRGLQGLRSRMALERFRRSSRSRN